MDAKLTRGERFKDARSRLPKGENSMDRVEEATGVTKSLIQALEDDNSNRDVGYSKVKALAEHYQTSIDYLLCLTDIDTPDQDDRTICEKTGLTPLALRHIRGSTGPKYKVPGIMEREDILKRDLFISMIECNELASVLREGIQLTARKRACRDLYPSDEHFSLDDNAARSEKVMSDYSEFRFKKALTKWADEAIEVATLKIERNAD